MVWWPKRRASSSRGAGHAETPPRRHSSGYSDLPSVGAASAEANPLDAVPRISAVRYGGNYKHPSTSASSSATGTSPRSPVASGTRASRASRSARSSIAPPHTGTAGNTPEFATVTIPRGLRPQQVPPPLHAEEEWGVLPAGAPSSASRRTDDLVQRWADAYRFGTLVPMYSVLRPAFKSGDVQRLMPARRAGGGSRVGFTHTGTATSTTTGSSVSPSPSLLSSLLPMPPGGHPQEHGLLSESAEEDAWMDEAGYLHLGSFSVRAAPPAAAAAAEARPDPHRVNTGASSAPPEVAVDSHVGEVRDRCGVSSGPTAEPLQLLCPLADSFATARLRREYSVDDLLARPPTTSPTSPSPPLSASQCPYLLLPRPSDIGWRPTSPARSPPPDVVDRVAAAAAPAGGEVARPRAVVDAMPWTTQDISLKGSSASEADGAAGDKAEMRYPGWSSEAGGSSVPCTPDEAAELPVDSNEGGGGGLSSGTQATPTHGHHAVPPPPPRECPPADAAATTSAPAVAVTSGAAARAARTGATVSFALPPSSARFRCGGRSAAALAEERMLTLLVLAKPAVKAVVKSTGGNGAQVSLPIVRAGGETPKGLCRVVVDEAVVAAAEEPCVEALLLRELAEEMCDGHSTALLLSVAGGCGGLGHRTVETALHLVLAAATRRLSEAQAEGTGAGACVDGASDYYCKLEVSIVLLHRGKQATDLVAVGSEAREAKEEEGRGAVTSLTRPVANPLAGTWCDNTVFQAVRSGAQLQKLLEPVAAWLEKTPEEADQAGETLGVYAALRQVHHISRPASERSATLSSLLIYVARTPDGAVGLVQDRDSGTLLQRSLLRRVGDGCFSVAAACVSEHSGGTDAYASLCAEAKTLPNSGFASGNATRYVHALRESLAREAAASRAVSPPATEQQQQQQQQQLLLRRSLLTRMEALLEDPENSVIPFFPDRVASHEEVAEKTEALARANAARDDNLSSLTSSVHSMSSDKCSFRVPTTAEALAMFSDCRVHTVAISDATESCGFEVVEGASGGLVRLDDRTTHPMDEVRTRRSLPPLHTQPIASTTSALCSLFASGHNAAVVSFDGRSDNVFSSPVWYVLAEAMERVLDGGNDNGGGGASHHLRIAFSLIRLNGEALDLLEPGATMVPLQVATSPIFGTTVHTSQLHRLTSQEELRPILHRVAQAATTQWTSDAFLYVSLVNCFSAADDVSVASFSFTVTGSHTVACRRILANGAEQDGPPLHPEVVRLHHGALAGSAATVFLTSLHNEEDSSVAVEMANSAVPRLKKTPTRSGSVSEFVRRTRNGLERRRLKAHAASAEERHHMERMEVRISEMLDDYTALLRSDAQELPRSYVNDHVVPPLPRDAAAAAAGHTPAPPTLAVPPSPLAASARTVSVAVPEDRFCKNAKEALPGGGGGGRRAAEDDSRGAPSAACSFGSGANSTSSSLMLEAVQQQHPLWVLGVERTGAAAAGISVTAKEARWAPTGERFDTDGVLFYEPALPDTKLLFTEGCGAVQAMLRSARAGRSCALLGLTDVAADGNPEHVRSQPLWRSYAALLLNTCFWDSDGSGTTWREGSELHLRLCAVQDRTLRHDFLAGDAPPPSSSLTSSPSSSSSLLLPSRVALAASPLFGPVVRNTTVMRATTLQECQRVLRNGLHALNELGGEYASGTIVIASAVLKNVTTDDVIFSSLTAFAGRVQRDLPAVRDVLAMDPRGAAPPSLYHYALRGPCHLMCLTTLGSADAGHSVEALRLSQSIRYGSAQPVPSGSLRQCVREQQEVLAERNGPLSPQARAATTNVLGELTKMLRDTSAPVVIFPLQEDGAPSLLADGWGASGYLHSGASLSFKSASTTPTSNGVDGVGGGGGGRCRCTAVVTSAPRGATPTLEVRVDANTVRTTRAVFPFTEVVLRADGTSLLRPSLLASVAERVQRGFNTSLIVADGVGSCSGVALLSKLVSALIKQPDSGRVRKTLYMSVTAARYPVSGGSDTPTPTVKDLFDAGGDFFPLRVARSLFFGACVDGARFSSLSRIGDVYLTLKDAQRACSFIQASLNVTMVLKQVIRTEDGRGVEDVVMSSLFAVVNSAENGQGPYACSVFDAMLDRRAAALAEAAGVVSPPSHDARLAWRRCLLADALGGENFTYGVVGVSASAASEEATSLLRFGARLMQVPCHPPPRSSARDVLRRAETHLGCADSSTVDAQSARCHMRWDWKAVKAEAEEMLRAPDTCKPQAFLCE
ncbi:hypothetical protein NESM_000282400 [Novymonas esmeraldas]|uniref:Uncharacterized protein n=1 Tax=Novymonas esmeraldas TaxID=1808958 RepID=A0AAW0F9R9_9TRYP